MQSAASIFVRLLALAELRTKPKSQEVESIVSHPLKFAKGEAASALFRHGHRHGLARATLGNPDRGQSRCRPAPPTCLWHLGRGARRLRTPVSGHSWLPASFFPLTPAPPNTILL